ncbi:MAG: hypothetical protein QW384_07055 [Archaeoglobaceae archaeon]
MKNKLNEGEFGCLLTEEQVEGYLMLASSPGHELKKEGGARSGAMLANHAVLERRVSGKDYLDYKPTKEKAIKNRCKNLCNQSKNQNFQI